jgi:hypothetical protein
MDVETQIKKFEAEIRKEITYDLMTKGKDWPFCSAYGEPLEFVVQVRDKFSSLDPHKEMHAFFECKKCRKEWNGFKEACREQKEWNGFINYVKYEADSRFDFSSID